MAFQKSISLRKLAFEKPVFVREEDREMEQVLFETVIQYGVYVVGLVLGGIGSVLGMVHLKNAWAIGVIGRAKMELEAAVNQVAQTYVGALRLSNGDGKITKEEAEKARILAIAAFKANFKWQALAGRLGRVVLGIDDVEGWIRTHLESAVGKGKEGVGVSVMPAMPVTMSPLGKTTR